MKKRLFPILLCLALATALEPAAAQRPGANQLRPDESSQGKPDDEEEEKESDFETMPVWRAELPGGVYVVAHDAVNSISSHEYVLDGAARVTEVNISTSGTIQARFYYIEPFIPQVPVGQEAVDRAKDAATALAQAASSVAGEDAIWMKVGKTYPNTTHAGTVEYRLESKADIEKLFQSLDRSWSKGRSETFRPGAAAGGRDRAAAREKKNQDSKQGERTAPEGTGRNLPGE